MPLHHTLQSFPFPLPSPVPGVAGLLPQAATAPPPVAVHGRGGTVGPRFLRLGTYTFEWVFSTWLGGPQKFLQVSTLREYPAYTYNTRFVLLHTKSPNREQVVDQTALNVTGPL